MELLTANKIAEKIGASPKAVAEFIKKNAIEPDQVKGPCKYYGADTFKKIQKSVKK